MKKRKCSICGETSPNKFYKTRKIKCKKCHNKEQHIIANSKRLKALKHLGGKCDCCGYKEHSCALDFHHYKDVDNKARDFGNMRCWAWKRIVEELKKCVILCAICHRLAHKGIIIRYRGKWRFVKT